MKTHEITAIGKSMRNTLIVCAAVPRRKICKFLICCFTEGFWEYLIYLAAIDQERNLALLIFKLEKGRMGDDGRVDDIVEREV